MKLDGGQWSGQFWITDLWRKSSLTRKWNLTERSLSRIDEDDSAQLARTAAMRALATGIAGALA